MGMIDHTSIGVSDYAKSKAFYEAVLPSIGAKLIMEPHGNVGGFGRPPAPDFWIGACPAGNPGTQHVAFTCDSKDQVDAFYEAAIKAGAKDNGKPGMRPQYHPNYYGAFVLDPDGHNIEAVFHGAT